MRRWRKKDVITSSPNMCSLKQTDKALDSKSNHDYCSKRKPQVSIIGKYQVRLQGSPSSGSILPKMSGVMRSSSEGWHAALCL